MRLFAAILLCCAAATCRAQESSPSMADLTGTVRHPMDAGGATASVLIFYLHDCPICNSYAPEINRLCAHYTNFNFYIVQVDPDLTEAAARTSRQDYGFHTPVLLDGRHTLVRLAQATVAPEAVVFGPEANMCFTGAASTIFTRPWPTRRMEATETRLARRPGRHRRRQTCQTSTTAHRLLHSVMQMKLTLRSVLLLAATPAAAIAATPTFDKDIAPIVYNNCAVCHRPGEVAPFSLAQLPRHQQAGQTNRARDRRKNHAAVEGGAGLRRVCQ